MNGVQRNFNSIMKEHGMQSEMSLTANGIYVIENEGDKERMYDVFSYMMSKSNILFLQGQVSDGMANILVAQMLFLEQQCKNGSDIQMYVNSPGGSVTAGLAIYDTMNFVKSDVSTIVMGQACSMGSFLASSGTKGKRYMTKMARHMIHQPLGGFQGQASDIAIHAREILNIKNQLNAIYAQNTGKTIQEIERDTDRDYFMSAQEALDYGLIDKII